MKKNSTQSTAFRVALGGICSAVCLLAMFCSGFLPMLDYAIPTFAGFLMVIMAVETDMKWAVATYAAVSLLCIFTTPNYEASILFILFMGYYPILKIYLDKKKNKTLVWLVKVAVFNGAVVLFYMFFKLVFTTDSFTEGMEMFGRYALLVLWIAANIFFLVYEYTLGQMIRLYVSWFRKQILRRR